MRSNINHNNRTQSALEIQRRRKSVAELMNRGDMSETEISNFLNCAKRYCFKRYQISKTPGPGIRLESSKTRPVLFLRLNNPRPG